MAAVDVKAEKIKPSLTMPALSTPNTVALIGLAAVALLLAMRTGFRPLNLG